MIRNSRYIRKSKIASRCSLLFVVISYLEYLLGDWFSKAMRLRLIIDVDSVFFIYPEITKCRVNGIQIQIIDTIISIPKLKYMMMRFFSILNSPEWSNGSKRKVIMN